MFELFSFIVAVAAIFSYINHKVLKLPPTIGVLILSLGFSGLLLLLQFVLPEVFLQICSVVKEFDFKTILFDFLLGFLLFAGAINVNLGQLLDERGPIIVFATLGVVISTAIVGSLIFLISGWLGIPLSFPESLVFGALISPTDPVAVLSLLRKANVNAKLEIKIVGESLFNDGIGIVVFLTLLTIAGGMSEEEVSAGHILITLLREAGGGLLLGVLLGYLGILSLKRLGDEPIIEVHVTVAIVMAGYALATFVEVSGALAMVVTGLMVGNSMSKESVPMALRRNLKTFWEILDEVFNAVLFVLIGIEILSLEQFDLMYLALAVAGILVVIIGRYLSAWIGNRLVKKSHRSTGPELLILTWAGLRGGISIALALNLTPDMNRSPIMFMTYCIVIFSILVQGLSIGSLVKRITQQAS